MGAEPFFSWAMPPEIPKSDNKVLENSGSVSTAAADEARAEAQRELQSPARRKRGPQKTATPSSGNPQSISPELAAEIHKQMEACYDPRAWAALLTLPGEVALAVTGHKHWKIEDEERETLGATGSAFARTLMLTNPRALAGLMLGSALFAVFVPRALEEIKLRKLTPGASKVENKT